MKTFTIPKFTTIFACVFIAVFVSLGCATKKENNGSVGRNSVGANNVDGYFIEVTSDTTEIAEGDTVILSINHNIADFDRIVWKVNTGSGDVQLSEGTLSEYQIVGFETEDEGIYKIEIYKGTKLLHSA